ncbi:MAG: DUF1015 domain-containing protein [Coriobacteriia bacterium]|nr:DUF1015 domain-containing protein [Coriobacteriia bacterium]
MPLVNPFRARVYRHEPGADLSSVTAPPYDVIGPAARAELLANDPYNVVALELPDGPLDAAAPGNRYENGAKTWRQWYKEGILVDDDSPAVYVVEQSWEYEGRRIRRRGFVAAVRLHPFSDGVILPHERTLPKALSDRLALTRSTAANLSQVFGLYSDPAGETDGVFDITVAAEPMYTATDAEGVLSKVWAIRDAATAEAVAEIIDDRPIFIADGHHRYTVSLAYRDERRAEDAAAGVSPVDPPYDFVMMTLVNMDDPELLVLPTHRLVRAEGTFDAEAFWEAMQRSFTLTEPTGAPTTAIAAPARTTFLVRTSDGTTRVATLRDDVDPAEVIAADHTDSWKRLDVTVLQEMVLKPLFGISPDDTSTLERLSFVKDAHEALRVEDADVAFLLAPTRMDQLREVALAGETMPQKSTYFYPKLLSGLLFRPLD